MTTINPYLSFNGQCEEAFNFYKSVFGGEFTALTRYSNLPNENVPESEKNKLLHISLPISSETNLFGADSSEVFGQTTKFGDNISLSISAESEKEAHRIFNALAKGGKIIMPLEKAFWGELFGHLLDKFGVLWMVSFNENKEED